MVGDNRQQVRRLFMAVADLPEPERQAALNRACVGDAPLRAEVEALLKADAEAGGFMASPTGDVAETAATAGAASSREQAGQTIGRYKLLQLLGEGGFGSVFMAEQEKPVSRKVALKIIKLGMDTRQVIARFEAERQALAMMDHPNIARVLDAGATEAGRPYFVMELVKGDPIAEYCDKNSLSIEDRLELFAQVCTAVQHAHTKGIIHRDLKPSNILVSTQDGRAHAKVIDFGIAKATAGKLTEKTLFTEHKALIGTPEYMSPEQAEGSLDIDTRTDVYSLGVLLYELLTGSTPFDARSLRSAAYAEILRIIREVEPPRPSTRLSQNTETIASVAAKRHSEPRRLGSIVRGELDWIVMKALEKDRQRRYETANGLAMDIRRYLSGEAVLAAPPSTAYRFKKFIRRNRVVVSAGSAVAAALLLGIIGFAWQAHRVGIERDAAVTARKAEERERRKSDAINTFIHEALQSSDPNEGGAQGMLVADAMMRAVTMLDEGIFKDQPEVEAGLRWTIAGILQGNGRSEDAAPLAEQALAIHRQLYAGDHPDVAACLNTLAYVRLSMGRADEAETLFAQALAMRRRLFIGDHSDVANGLCGLAIVLTRTGRPAEAEPLLVEALEMEQRLHAGDHRDVARALNNLAYGRWTLGRAAEAELLFVQALEMRERLFRYDHPDTAASLDNLASVRQALGRAEEAEPLLARAVEVRGRLFKGDHPEVAQGLNNLAFVRLGLGRAAEAEPLFAQALAMRQRLHEGDDTDTAVTLGNLARARHALGRTTEARRGFDDAVAMLRRLSPEGSAPLARLLWRSGSARLDNKDALAALPELEEAVEMAEKFLPPEHPQLKEYGATLAECKAALAETAAPAGDGAGR